MSTPAAENYKIKITAHDVDAILSGEGYPVCNWLKRMGEMYDIVANERNPDWGIIFPEENLEHLLVSQLDIQSELIFPISRRGDTDKFVLSVLKRAIMIVDRTIQLDRAWLNIGIEQVKKMVFEMNLSVWTDFNRIARLLWIIELVRRRTKAYGQ